MKQKGNAQPIQPTQQPQMARLKKRDHLSTEYRTLENQKEYQFKMLTKASQVLVQRKTK